MPRYDYLIVGSGLFGSTFAYRAKQMGKKCLVIDKRPHLGGNVYCEPYTFPTGEGQGEDVINVHKYGAHIFHTNSKDVWDFVNSFVEFNRYTNSPIANYRGELYNLPFNMNTFNRMWPDVHTPAQAEARIAEQRADALAALKGREPANLEEQALCLVGKDIYLKLIKQYTEKQWGRDCMDLPAFIIKRLPVRMIFDNNYFNDRYQGIPIGGYNRLVDGLLEGVDCLTDTDFFNVNVNELYANLSKIKDVNQEEIITENLRSICGNLRLKDCWCQVASRLVYTGAIDEYFDYKSGKLDWRTVSFKTRIEDSPNYQGNAVINYTSHDEPYTRIIEHKHFEMFGQQVYDCPKTVISEEYSAEYKEGMEPYYPVNDERNNALVEKYRELAHSEGVLFPEDMNSLPTGEGRGESNVIFGGRLAEYKYYDMAPIIEKVLSIKLF